MKKRNILRAKKYCNQETKCKVFEKRISWIFNHLDITLKGMYRGDEYEWTAHCGVSVAMPSSEKRHLRVAPHLSFVEDEEEYFIGKKMFITASRDKAKVTDEWVQKFWAR